MTEDTQSFVEKYRPEKWEDIQGHNSSLDHIQNWIENFEAGDRPQLLVGDAGNGKTSTAQVASKETGYPIYEINLSDTRRSEDIQKLVTRLRTKPTQSEYQIILLDEVDSMSDVVNLEPLYDVLRNPNNPIFLTANDEYEVPGSIQGPVKTHKFSLGKRSKKSKIRDIVEEEDINISKQQIGKLASRNGLRDAIQDLQTFTQSRSGDVGWDDREEEMSEFDAVENLMTGTKWVGMNVKPPDLIGYLNENVASEFRLLESFTAYEAISKADVQEGRAGQTQDYSYWKYAGELAEQVANLRLTEPYGGYVERRFPEQWRHKTPKPDDGTPEAALYRDLSNYGEGRFGLGGGYIEFRNTVLPVLERLDRETKFELCLNEDIEEDAIEALGLQWSEYEDWREQESAETGEWTPDQKRLF